MYRSPSVKSYQTYYPSSDAGLSDGNLTVDVDATENETDPEPITPSRSQRRSKQSKQEHDDDDVPSVPAFDAYFVHATQSSRTSANVFSELVQPLSAEEYVSSISASFYPHPAHSILGSLFSEHRATFPQYIRELDEGFNILFYGLGSKRRVLNAFVSLHLRKRGEVIVINGYHPMFSMKDIIPACDKIPGIAELPLPSSGVEGHLQRIAHFFSAADCERSLYVVIHNLDAASLRNTKARAQLSILLSAANVHTIASIDHLNAPLLFKSSDLFASSSSSALQHSWLWHDLSTLEGYDTELAFADKDSLRGASSRSQADASTTKPGATGAQMTESAAQHVLLSVTTKAKKLFALLARHQLDADAETGATTTGYDADRGMAYDQLFTVARDNFVATNDGAFRALLGEFRDHGLIVTTTTGTFGSGEMLLIPMRKERLAKLVKWLQEKDGS